MAITFTTTMAGASADYDRYVFGGITKTDRYLDPSLLDFALAPIDGAFVNLRRGAYIVIDSTKYPKWFTGYVSSEPEYEYLGVNASKQKVWGYKFQATSDEYILSLKPIGLVAPFTNVHMGQIIKTLATMLCPGTFNVSNVQDGPLVAQYTVDPDKRFSDVVKELQEAAAYNFYANDHKLYFLPQDDAATEIELDYNDRDLTPARLALRPSANQPVINDVTVLGQVGPTDYVTEYFLGTGLDSVFPLVSSVFGADTTVLIDETFSGSSINSNLWDVYDTPSTFLEILDGYLNCLGGSNNGSYDVSMRSKNPLALDGRLRLTHGEWDFTSSSLGVIASLWTAAPNSSLTGCLYGLKVNGTTINPIVNGSVDSGQSLTVDTTGAKRYVIRTLVEFTNNNRLQQPYAYIDQNGVRQTMGGSTLASSVTWNTIITEINTADGSIADQTAFKNETTVNGSDAYATYVPLASDNLHVNVSAITVSVPINATLELAEPGTLDFTSQLIGPNEIDAMDGLAPIATVVSGNLNQNTKSSESNISQYNRGQSQLVFFKDSITRTSSIPPKNQLIRLSYRAAGPAAGRTVDYASISSEALKWGDNGRRAVVRTDLVPRPRTAAECELAAAAVVAENSFVHYEGSYEQFSDYFTSEPKSGAIFKFVNFSSLSGNLNAEEVNQVQTTIESKTPEIFKHNISFGKSDTVRRALAKFASAKDQFQRDQVSSVIRPSNVMAAGSGYAADVTSPRIVGWDDTTINMDAGQNLSGSDLYFEVRYTDSGWGTDSDRNLIVRSASRYFDVPRNLRGRVFFIKLITSGNRIPYSEDMGAITFSGGSVSVAVDVNLDGNLANISTVALSSGTPFTTSLSGLSGSSFVFGFDIKGPQGTVITANLGGTTSAITLTGYWQRVHVSRSGSAPTFASITCASSVSVQTNRWSVLPGSLTEATYSKTAGSAYGPSSRFAAVVQVAFPAVDTPGDVQPISGDDFTIDNILEDDVNATVEFSYSPPGTSSADIGSFDGVAIYVEVPDGSGNIVSAGTADYNGDPDGVGSARYGAGRFVLPQPDTTGQDWKVFLCSRARDYQKALVLSGTGETPNMVISINPRVLSDALPAQVASTSDFTATLGSSRFTQSGEEEQEIIVTITNPPVGTPGDSYPGVWGFTTNDPITAAKFDDRSPWFSAAGLTAAHPVWVKKGATTVSIYLFPTINTPRATAVPDNTYQYATVTVPANSGTAGSPPPGQLVLATDFTVVAGTPQPHEATGVLYKKYTITATTLPSGLPSDARISVFAFVGPNPATDARIRTGLNYDHPWVSNLGVGDPIEVWIEMLPSTQTIYFFAVIQADSAPVVYPTSSFAKNSVTVPSMVGATAGQEYADFVTGASVTFIESRDAGKNPIFVLESAWTNPSDDRYGGVKLKIIATSAIGILEPRDLATEMEGSVKVRSGPFPMPTAPGFTYRVYFASVNKLNQMNQIVDGVTPHVDVFVGETIGSAGQEYAPFVTGLTGALNSGFQNADGVDMFNFDGGFTEPVDLTRYAGSEIWYWPFPYSSTNPNNRQLATCPLGITKYQTDDWPIYATAEAFEIYALSYDAVGRVNTVTASTPKLSGTVTKSASGKLKLASRGDSSEIGAGLSNSGSTLNIPTNGIANSMVQAGAIDNVKLGALAVDAAKLASSAVTSTKIANAAVGTAAIANAAVGTAQIANASITNALVADMSVAKLTAGNATFAGLVAFTSAFGVQFLTGVPTLMWGVSVQTAYMLDLGSKITMSGNGGTNPYISDVAGGGGGRLTFTNIIHTATTGYTPPSGFMLYDNAGQLRIRFASGVDKEVVLL